MQLFSRAPGFDDPLGLLAACHQRIARHCDTLKRLPAHLETHGADRSAREAAQAILRYFREAGPKHHADEETDLFPRLRQCLGRPGCPPQLEGWLRRLEAEHRAQDEAWGALAPALDVLARGRRPATLPTEPFLALYRRHLALENDRILPLAGRLLAAETLAAMGRAMAARRGLRP